MKLILPVTKSKHILTALVVICAIFFVSKNCYALEHQVGLSKITQDVIDSPSIPQKITEVDWSPKKVTAVIMDTKKLTPNESSKPSELFLKCIQIVIDPFFPADPRAVPILQWGTENADTQLARLAAVKLLAHLENSSSSAESVLLDYLRKYKESNHAAIVANELFIAGISLSKRSIDSLWEVITDPSATEDVASILTKTFIVSTNMEKFIEKLNNLSDQERQFLLVLRGVSMLGMEKDFSSYLGENSTKLLRRAVYQMAENAKSKAVIIQTLRTSFALLGTEQIPPSEEQLKVNKKFVSVIRDIIEKSDDSEIKKILTLHGLEFFKPDGSLRTYEEWRERLNELES